MRGEARLIVRAAGYQTIERDLVLEQPVEGSRPEPIILWLTPD